MMRRDLIGSAMAIYSFKQATVIANAIWFALSFSVASSACDANNLPTNFVHDTCKISVQLPLVLFVGCLSSGCKFFRQLSGCPVSIIGLLGQMCLIDGSLGKLCTDLRLVLVGARCLVGLPTREFATWDCLTISSFAFAAYGNCPLGCLPEYRQLFVVKLSNSSRPCYLTCP